jgi:8-oxo-dGTP pyrophosphatase MutT (NUDIX family)
MNGIRKSTLLFLVRRDEETGEVSDVCLAMKRRGFGEGRWNGAGGKCEPGESVEDAVRRETEEEILVSPGELVKAAELEFLFPHEPDWDQLVHVFLAEDWEGEPGESEEMSPRWFGIHDIPFDEMWPDDPFWLPRVLDGESLRARFVFGEGDEILEQEIKAVSGF